MKLIGIAIGGTKSAVTFASYEEGYFTIEKKTEIKTYPESDQKTLSALMEIIDRENFPFAMISLISGGPLDTRQGVILNPPHLPGFIHTEIVKIFQGKYHCPVTLLNDADACALAEYVLGHHHAHNMAFITFGTGIGAGLILNDKLYTGNNSMAGEIGHVRLTEKGPVGYGKEGSVEGWCAGGNIPLWVKDERFHSAKELFDYARSGDTSALKAVDQVAEKLGESISVLLDLFNLDIVVIGGIYPRNLDLLEEKVKVYTKKNAIPYNYDVAKIVPSFLKEQMDEYSSLMGVYMNKNNETFYQRYPELENQKDEIESAVETLVHCYQSGGKILVCGNGGSASDSAHIVGELMKGFMSKRKINPELADKLSSEFGNDEVANKLQTGVPCIDLTSQASLLTAFSNDVDPELIFAQEVIGYSAFSPNDVVIGLSTSGNSKNVVAAVRTGNALGLKTIALTGEKESALSQYASICIKAPASETYQVQEYHLPIYHYICQEIEKKIA